MNKYHVYSTGDYNLNCLKINDNAQWEKNMTLIHEWHQGIAKGKHKAVLY